jgi:hypothetical protein
VPFKENLLVLEKVSHNFLQMGDFGSQKKSGIVEDFECFFSRIFLVNGFEVSIG